MTIASTAARITGDLAQALADAIVRARACIAPLSPELGAVVEGMVAVVATGARQPALDRALVQFHALSAAARAAHAAATEGPVFEAGHALAALYAAVRLAGGAPMWPANVVDQDTAMRFQLAQFATYTRALARTANAAAGGLRVVDGDKP